MSERTTQHQMQMQSQRTQAAVQVLTSSALFRHVASFMPGFPQRVIAFARRVEPQHRRWLAYQHSQLPPAERTDAMLSVRGMLPFVAVKEGDMAMLQTLYELQRFRFYRQHEKLQFCDVVAAAVQYGRLEMLKWLHDKRARESSTTTTTTIAWDAGLMSLAIRHRHVEIMDWIYTTCPREELSFDVQDIHWRARSGNLRVIQWLHQRGFAFTTREMDEAAKHDHLSDLQFLHEHRSEGCTTSAMDAAASRGNLEIVRFLHEHRSEGCTTAAMDGAAKNGYLEVVRFLHEHRSEGCTTDAMDYAAGYGHLEIVQFLHERRKEGCTPNAMYFAAMCNHVAVVKFLGRHRLEGCTLDALREAARKNLPEVVRALCEYSTVGCLVEAMSIAKAFRYQAVVAVLTTFLAPNVKCCASSEHYPGRPRRCQKPKTQAQVIASLSSSTEFRSVKETSKRAFIRDAIRKCLGKAPVLSNNG